LYELNETEYKLHIHYFTDHLSKWKEGGVIDYAI
jgi:hypothetical protein